MAKEKVKLTDAKAKGRGKRIPKTVAGLMKSNENETPTPIADGKVSEMIGVALGRTKRIGKSNPRYIDNDTDESVNENRGKIGKDLNAKIKATVNVDVNTLPKNKVKKTGDESKCRGKLILKSNRSIDYAALEKVALNEKENNSNENQSLIAYGKNELLGVKVGRTKQMNKSNSPHNTDDMLISHPTNDGANDIQEVAHEVSYVNDTSPPIKNKKIRETKIKYALDCTDVGHIVDVVEMANYLRKNIKVGGVKNDFGKKVLVKEKSMRVYVKSSWLKKKDVKYWTNKFLKEKKLRTSVRILCNGKFSYKLFTKTN